MPYLLAGLHVSASVCVFFSLFSTQVIGQNCDPTGRVIYEGCSCITTVLCQVAQSAKACSTGAAEMALPSVLNESLKKVLDHAEASRLVDHLCTCLAAAGSSLSAGSSNMTRTAIEACRAIWSLVDALENICMKGNAKRFPLDAFRDYKLPRLDIKDHSHDAEYKTALVKAVDALSKAFIKSKSMQYAISHCLQRADSVCIQVCIFQWLKQPFTT